MLKCIHVKGTKNRKARKQCARVLASGRYKFVKNSTAGCQCGR